ncbi:methyltransferase domain-containing protein [Jidongwangia harbinensis]|uniref:methyltransferase domain-containing protein n=1 Tax=Jidongwangia harbinensis TaxID=2878561 RepID=UPI001CDA2C2C|nr:methyltransferase domain-containing protein [Jidongwangia harbinensis]MCA2217790.1 methyltransferase domain-containing protein [Jidongwangia harbinensis]
MTTDRWARWVLSRRDGEDPALRRQFAPALHAYRDGVLARAAIRPGDVVLDVGTGAGLVGFGALERVGPDGRVIFNDVSAALLDECRRRAGDDPRCSFLHASADDLTGVADAAVDVVTTRSVLMYLADQRPAFAEFARVLRPGGRLSIFEPVNRFLVGRDEGRWLGLDLAPVADLVDKVQAVYRASEPDEAPIVAFDERDLLARVEQAGFTGIELDYRAQVGVLLDGPSPDWAAVRRTAPNPLVPTYEEAMEATLTGAERERLEDAIRERLAAGAPRRLTLATAYLRAVRP